MITLIGRLHTSAALSQSRPLDGPCQHTYDAPRSILVRRN